MRTKSKEHSQAIVLRRKGESLSSIAHALGVSKSSVSLWLRKVELPTNALRILEIKRRNSRLLASATKKRITEHNLAAAAQEAAKVVSSQTVNQRSALILCSLMYWCEGSKSKNDSEFTFTNSDPLTICGFLSLLRTAFPSIDNERFRIKMHLHNYHSESVQKKFWSKLTGIPMNQFQSTYWKKNSGRITKHDYPGCIHVRYHDVKVARKVSAVARNFLTSLDMLK